MRKELYLSPHCLRIQMVYTMTLMVYLMILCFLLLYYIYNYHI